MGSAVEIVMELYEALSEKERVEVIEKILRASTVKSAHVSAVGVEFGKSFDAWAVKHVDTTPVPRPPKKGWKKPLFWTKSVDSVDILSLNASGAEGKWGFEPGQKKPVLLGLNKPRHLYAVLKATPGGVATITDDDGFEITVPGATVVMTSKDWVAVRERLTEMLIEF